MDRIEEGDTVILMTLSGKKIRVSAEKRTLKVKGLGVANLGRLIGSGYGEPIVLAGKEFLALRPSIIDLIETLERKAQIIVPKDAAYIILHCGIGPDKRVVEGGSGSGSLTLALAGAIAPHGMVYSYDRREEHQIIARRNLERAGLSHMVTWKKGDLSEGIDEKDVDAVVLDIPEPWVALGNISKVLRTGGHLGAYVPTTNQVERTVKALRKAHFTSVKAVELILREMEVSEGGVRPCFSMLGHTGYICIGRWMG